jgi:hypothetical protein
MLSCWTPTTDQSFQALKEIYVHNSLLYLKCFVEKIISSPEQHKWVTKMFGYDHEIIYKKRKENVVVDALSKKYEEGSLFSLSFIVLRLCLY